MKLGRWQAPDATGGNLPFLLQFCTVVPSLGEEQSEPLVGGCTNFCRETELENPIICHAKHPKPPVASLRLFSVGTDACCLEREEKCPQERHGLPTQNVGISHSLCSPRHLVHTTMKEVGFLSFRALTPTVKHALLYEKRQQSPRKREGQTPLDSR